MSISSLFGRRPRASDAETKLEQIRSIVSRVNVPNGTTKQIARILG